MNLAFLLAAAATAAGDRTAVIEPEGTADYRHLHSRMGAIQTALLSRGLRPGDRVAVMLTRGAEAAAAIFAVFAAGGVAVVLHDTLRPRQIDHILADAGVRLLLTTSSRLAELSRPLEHPVALLDLTSVPTDVRRAASIVPRAPDAVAQIVYTSGSTGLPKGVMVTHGNLRAATGAITDYLTLTAHDRIASLLPFGFVYGMSQLLCAVACAATLVVEHATLPRDIVRALAERRITVLAAVPPLWLRLLGGGGLKQAELPALRIMTNAGGHLPVDTVRALRRAQPEARLFLMYGLTEVLRSTYLPPEEVDRHPDSIGRALPGAEVLLVGDQGEIVLGAGTGELVHRGPTVTRGYWNDPERTRQVFRPDPRDPTGPARVVYSGDIVRRDAEGFLYYVGRADRIIKTMGFRVGPDEVLDALHATGEVAEAVVTGEPDPLWGARIVAYLVLRPGGSLDRVVGYCARELPRFMQPGRYEVRDQLPLLPSGKHDLTALRQGVATG